MKDVCQNMMHRIQIKRRKSGFKYGLSGVAIKEYRTPINRVVMSSFVVSLDAEQGVKEIRDRVKAEILSRLNAQGDSRQSPAPSPPEQEPAQRGLLEVVGMAQA